MDDLIRDLEAATEGSRELDQDIAQLIGVGAALYSDNSGVSRAPDYSTSLDAALTLVPEGWITMLAGQNPVSGTWYWGLHKQAEAGINDGFCQQTESQELFNSNHQTNSAAIAVCIASLRARQRKND